MHKLLALVMILGFSYVVFGSRDTKALDFCTDAMQIMNDQSQRRHSQVIKHGTDYVLKHGQDKRILMEMATAYYALGDYLNAVGELKKSLLVKRIFCKDLAGLEIDLLDQSIHMRLSILFDELGDFKESEKERSAAASIYSMPKEVFDQFFELDQSYLKRQKN